MHKEGRYKFIRLLYAMTTVEMPNRRSYWSTEDGLFTPPAFGERLHTGYHRFEDILCYLSFDLDHNSDVACVGDDERESDDWWPVR